MISKTLPLYNPPPIPLEVLHLEALAADLAAAGIVASAEALHRRLSRNLVSRSFTMGNADACDR